MCNNTEKRCSYRRVHDGAAEILKDLDNDEKTVTIKTDRFSTYALAYADKSDNTSGNTSSGTSADSTSDTSSRTSDNASDKESGTGIPNSADSETSDSYTNPASGITASLVPTVVLLLSVVVVFKKKK